MIFDVRHKTSYSYGSPVSVAYHLLRVEPRDMPGQQRLKGEVVITPQPQRRLPDQDYFGNHTLFLTIERQHGEFVVEASSRVEVNRRPPPAAAATPSWETVLDSLEQPDRPALLAAVEQSYPTPRTPILPECLAYARESFTPGRPILDAALELNHRIFEDFRYDPGATHTHTPTAQAFAMRRGVCQDFTHVALACFHSLGLPARYVSGYLMTRPPPGKERLVGADASHAWVSVWVGPEGWVDLDPTNDVVVGDHHVTLAYGRDYSDVAPVSGIIYGGGRHKIAVAVDVIPLNGP
ncbi:Transglutaminase-like enzyme, putative cysteine protease [Arboricoccus pini]|uniref:Transglutaminase-like enzyme, putative cysteine protease n=1 Tax=Arboricoccus pini TaxID=1963835 RepID=A0A212PYY3_9PROT|nr:transglutaminase family protein [Arboricoccus pini]SNB52331.1 Transglutaminase-like enzyme, putative cysteine protease [Arboricoccus pini]